MNVFADGGRRLYSFFVRVEFTGRVKALLRSELLPRLGQRRAFTPAVILFIALPEPEDKSDPG
jgi:hypothetical protein